MLLHFFILFSISAFVFATIYALFSIVLKIEIKLNSKIIHFFKNPTLLPIIILLSLGLLFLVFSLLYQSSSYQYNFKSITSNGNSIGTIGDLFNGLITPTVSIISIIYLWRAFVQQFKANQMLYNFEIEKSFKDDLDWLRNNSVYIETLEKQIENKDNSELALYFSSTEINDVRKVIYIINIFEQIYVKLESKKSKENDFSDVSQEALLLLESLYLPTLKNIYRKIGNYILNLSDEEKENIDLKKPLNSSNKCNF